MLNKLREKDIEVNVPVDWPIYSASGRLLLHPGQSFKSEQLIEVLLWRGLFHGNKSTFESGDYEELVNIENEPLAEYETEKERENYNDDFSALADKQSKQNALFQVGDENSFNEDNDIQNGDDFNLSDEKDFSDGSLSSRENPYSFTTNEKNIWLMKLKMMY